MNLGLAIKKIRMDELWTMKDLADIIGTNAGHISRIEKGGNFTIRYLEAIADAFDLFPSELLKFAEKYPN